MKKIIYTAVAALVLTANTAFATTVTVDFEGIGTGFQPDGTSYSGLVFDDEFDIQLSSNFTLGPGQSGVAARDATPPFGAVPRGGSVGGFFYGFTVSSLSFVVGDSGGDLDIFRLLGFDINGNQIADSGELSSNSAITVGIAGTGIARFFLDIADLPDNDGSSVFDNIQFNQEVAAVPVPAAFPLLAGGLGFMGLLGWRRKRRAVAA